MGVDTRRPADAQPTPRRSGELVVEALGRGDPDLDDHLAPGGRAFGAWLAHWRGLGIGERDPLSHPALTGAWLRHLALPSGRDFRLLVVRDRCDGRLVAAHPAEVVPARVGPGCVLRRDPVLYLEDASLAVAAGDRAVVLEALTSCRVPGAGRVRALVLGRVDGTHGLLVGGSAIAVEEGHRSIIDLRRGWAGVEEALSKNFRRNLVKAEHKLERLEGVELHTVVEPGRTGTAFERLVDVEARSWKGEAGSGLGADEAFRDFWHAVLEACAPRREAVVQLLVAGGEDIAAQLCLHLDDTLHVMKVAYDAEHSRLAPGNLLLSRAMQGYCAERDVRWVSLVTGLDWHDKWRPERLRTFRLLLPAPGPLGSVSALLSLQPRQAARFALARAGWLDAAVRVRDRLAGAGPGGGG